MNKTITTDLQLMEMLNLLASESCFYFSYNEEILDFTDRTKAESYKIIIMAKKAIYEVPMQSEWMMRLFFKASKETIFRKDVKLIVWNLKNFISFCLAKFNLNFNFDCSVVDLKIIESFMGHKFSKPASFAESINRLRSIFESGSWNDIQKTYKAIYLPLIMNVVPEMETVGILTDKKLHAYYEIAGQDNGRLLCYNAYNRGYVPHIMNPDTKDQFKPLDFDQLFVYFDYKSMEVKILQWLSQDQELQKVCESDDIYKTIYELITKTACDTDDKRSLCKRFFLPVFYGMGSNSLSEQLGISTEVAQSIVDRIKKIFSISYNWIEDHQIKAKQQKYICDIFGKKRVFTEKEYKARNFVVQSPAAIFCLEKLILLRKSLNGIAQVAYNIHDGYMIFSNRENLKKTILESQSVLLSKSELFQNLQLDVSCYVGRKLTELKKINLKKRE